MRTRTERDTRTAAQAYEENMTAIETLLRTLSGQLAEHKAKQATEPRHWGYVGDLGEVRSRLETAVSFLANDEEQARNLERIKTLVAATQAELNERSAP